MLVQNMKFIHNWRYILVLLCPSWHTLHAPFLWYNRWWEGISWHWIDLIIWLWHRDRILVHVTIYRRLRIGRNGYLDQSEAYDISIEQLHLYCRIYFVIYLVRWLRYRPCRWRRFGWVIVAYNYTTFFCSQSVGCTHLTARGQYIHTQVLCVLKSNT